MKRSWILFVLATVGALVVGLYLFRKINPAPVVSVASGGAGVQSATPAGYKRETGVSVIEIGPATVTPVWNKENTLMTWLEDV